VPVPATVMEIPSCWMIVPHPSTLHRHDHKSAAEVIAIDPHLCGLLVFNADNFGFRKKSDQEDWILQKLKKKTGSEEMAVSQDRESYIEMLSNRLLTHADNVITADLFNYFQ
jgi:hypothetical protein